MATPQGISLKINAMLGVDTSEAEAAIQSLGQQAGAAIQQGVAQATSKPATIKVQVESPPSVAAWSRQVEETRARAGGAPFVVTTAQRQQCADLGYHRAEVNQLKPDEALHITERNITATRYREMRAAQDLERQQAEAQRHSYQTATEQMQERERMEHLMYTRPPPPPHGDKTAEERAQAREQEPPKMADGKTWQQRIDEAHGPQPHGGKTAIDWTKLDPPVKSTPPHTPASDIAKMRFQEQFGPGFSYIQKEKEARVMIAEQLKLVRDLTEAYTLLKERSGSSSDERVKAAKQARNEEAAHLNALRSELDEGLRKEKILGQMADDAAGGGLIQGMTIQQAMKGGLIGRMLGGAGSLIMRNPIVAGTVAVTGAGLWGMNKMADESEMAQSYNVASMNVGRKTGRGRSMRDLTEPLGALGYTPQQALAMADAYGMAGSDQAMRGTYHAIGVVARDAGFGENPEVVAGLARRATQMGIQPGPQQEQFWAMMQRSMSEGVKVGVDKAERMKALFAMMEATAVNTGVLSKEMVAGLAATTGILSEGGRLLSGEKGAQTYMGMMESFQHPASPAQEFMQINAWKTLGSGGQMPTPEELVAKYGVTSMQDSMKAGRYKEMGDIERAKWLNELTPIYSKLATGFLGGLTDQYPSGGPQRMLTESALHRIPYEMRGEIASELGVIIDKYKGKGTAERLGTRDIDTLEKEALKAGATQVEVDALLKSKMPKFDGISPEEKKRVEYETANLKAAETMLKASLEFSIAVSHLKGKAAEWLIPTSERLGRTIGLLNEGRPGRATVEAGVGLLQRSPLGMLGAVGAVGAGRLLEGLVKNNTEPGTSREEFSIATEAERRPLTRDRYQSIKDPEDMGHGWYLQAPQHEVTVIRHEFSGTVYVEGENVQKGTQLTEILKFMAKGFRETENRWNRKDAMKPHGSSLRRSPSP